MPAAAPELKSGNNAEDMTKHRTASHPSADGWRHALFEHIPVAIIVSSPETGAIIAANPKACRVLGYTEVRLRSLRTADIFVATGDPGFPVAQESGNATREFRGELTFRCADGALLPVELNRSWFAGADDSSACINAFTPLSDRTVAETVQQQSSTTGSRPILDNMSRPAMDLALRESEQRLRAATEVAALGVWAWDRSADVLTWDDRMRAIHGVSTDMEPTIAAWGQMIHPDDRAAVAITTQKVMATDRQVSVEYRVVHRDGTTHSVLCSGGVVNAGAGGMTHQLGVCLDVTELRRAEESLSRLAAIIDAATDAIVSTKFDGVITSWNPGAEKLYGHRAGDVLGHNVFDLVPPGQRALMPGFIERIRDGETIKLPDLRWTTPEQRQVDLAITLAPIPDRAGQWAGISSVAHDITQRKRAEAAVAESEARMKAVIENTSDLIWSVDRQYQLLVANAACLESTQRALWSTICCGSRYSMRLGSLLPGNCGFPTMMRR
ncbi:MAG: PAS domain S-box protein [Anaerolineales bacterium]|nr:PAS domain S-box protein [Anaerolineales bacterium]